MIFLMGWMACSDYDLKRDEDNGGGADQDTSTPDDTAGGPSSDVCELGEVVPREVGLTDTCTYEISGFTPVEYWTAGSGSHSMAAPAVADLDGDGIPEIIANVGGLFLQTGDLLVIRGDTGAVVWTTSGAELGYGSSPAVADLDGDGSPEIVIVRQYAQSLFAVGDFTAVAYSAQGEEIWESEHYAAINFDQSTAASISDMDHDGAPEVVVGRVILNADGTTRGVGDYGRGSYGIVELPGVEWVISESSVSAVADIDLNGVEEVIVGNALYNPDGGLVNADPSAEDAMIGIANLDSDPEGEIVASTYNTVRAMDTDMSVIWGPITLQSANITSPPAIGDIDGDGEVEIVVAGGNDIYALNADGSTLWREQVTDQSGASGASLFDFEADGVPEVVYADEIQLMAFDGPTGTVRFQSDQHASVTIVEYPVIADVDADGHADIVVVHNGLGYAISVYRDAANSWGPTRTVWNQHPYCITNINDDLSVPVTAEPGFSTYNLWHGALGPLDMAALVDDLESEIVDACADCDAGTVTVQARVLNRSPNDMDPGIPVALYGRWSDGDRLVAQAETADLIPSAWSGEVIEMTVPAADLAGATALWFVSDDDGSGAGIVEECTESNNGFQWSGDLCE